MRLGLKLRILLCKLLYKIIKPYDFGLGKVLGQPLTDALNDIKLENKLLFDNPQYYVRYTARTDRYLNELSNAYSLITTASNTTYSIATHFNYNSIQYHLATDPDHNATISFNQTPQPEDIFTHPPLEDKLEIEETILNDYLVKIQLEKDKNLIKEKRQEICDPISCLQLEN